MSDQGNNWTVSKFTLVSVYWSSKHSKRKRTVGGDSISTSINFFFFSKLSFKERVLWKLVKIVLFWRLIESQWLSTIDGRIGHIQWDFYKLWDQSTGLCKPSQTHKRIASLAKGINRKNTKTGFPLNCELSSTFNLIQIVLIFIKI